VVEFVGMIGTRHVSEIRPAAGPVIDPEFVERFARVHEDGRFDRVRAPTARATRRARRRRRCAPRAARSCGHRREPAAHRANVERLLGRVRSGQLTPHVHAELPLEQYADGLRMLAGRAVRGKVLVTLR